MTDLSPILILFIFCVQSCCAQIFLLLFVPCPNYRLPNLSKFLSILSFLDPFICNVSIESICHLFFCFSVFFFFFYLRFLMLLSLAEMELIGKYLPTFWFHSFWYSADNASQDTVGQNNQKYTDCSTKPLTCPFARSLTPLT